MALQKKLPLLIPPFRFATVEEGLYRGAYPKSRNLRFLKRLKLKTLLSLIPDPPDADIKEFCAQQGIRVIHLKINKMKEDNIPLNYSQTVHALQIMINATNLPIYVHCLDGSDVTGLVIACLRRLQMWSLMPAMGEFSRFLRASALSSDATDFVERFSGTGVDVITVPREIPGWLWGGSVTFRRHPVLSKFKFLNPEIFADEEREARERVAMGGGGGAGTGASGVGGTAGGEGSGNRRREREKEEYRKRREELLEPSSLPRRQASSSLQRSGSPIFPIPTSNPSATVTASTPLSISQPIPTTSVTVSVATLAEKAKQLLIDYGSSEDDDDVVDGDEDEDEDGGGAGGRMEGAEEREERVKRERTLTALALEGWT